MPWFGAPFLGAGRCLKALCVVVCCVVMSAVGANGAVEHSDVLLACGVAVAVFGAVFFWILVFVSGVVVGQYVNLGVAVVVVVGGA